MHLVSLRRSLLLAACAVVALALVGALLPRLADGQPAERAEAHSGGASADPVAVAQDRFDRGRYGEGLEVLNQASRQARRSHVEYARLLTKLAY
ncbi:MAG: hypothetical protein JRI23_21950, partial [Deltaproteobacteria bacterium]|nr:hypothetical protein [Deltaproteobacteria bacterium]MBW2534622.1 hypothetical protein [Deltaproteobacteria bacterium]